jgi:hypothetical protein
MKRLSFCVFFQKHSRSLGAAYVPGLEQSVEENHHLADPASDLALPRLDLKHQWGTRVGSHSSPGLIQLLQHAASPPLQNGTL